MDTYSQQKSHAGSNLLKYVQVKLETRNILNFLFNNNNNNVNMKKFNSMTFHEIIKNAYIIKIKIILKTMPCKHVFNR